MALKISKNVGLTDIVSQDSTNPITTSHSISGGSQTLQLWLYNDSSSKRYESIQILPEDLVSTSEASWIQMSSDGSTFLSGGAALSMANISDSNVAKPFWIKVTTPAVGDSMNKTDIKLKVSFTEFAV
jgi:hypothetical protein